MHAMVAVVYACGCVLLLMLLVLHMCASALCGAGGTYCCGAVVESSLLGVPALVLLPQDCARDHPHTVCLAGRSGALLLPLPSPPLLLFPSPPRNACLPSSYPLGASLACAKSVIAGGARLGVPAVSDIVASPLLRPCLPLQLLFYTPLGMGKLGESWSVYSWIQAAG